MRVDLDRFGGKRVLLAIAAVVAAVAAVVALVIALRGRGLAREAGEISAGAPDWAAAAELVLLDEPGGGREFGWVPSQPRRELWTTSEIEPFWFDPDSIGREYLERTIEQRLQRLIAEVP